MTDALLAALRERSGLLMRSAAADLKPLPATGTAHGHVRLPDGRLARVAYAHEGDPDGGGAPARAGRSVPPSRAGRPHAASARRDRAARRPAGRRADRRLHRWPRAAPAGRTRRHGRHAGAHPCAAAAVRRLADPAPEESLPRDARSASSRTPCASSTRPCPTPARAPRSPRSCSLMRGMAPAFAQARAAAHRGAGRHPSRQLHRRSRAASPGSSISRKSMSARPRSISRMQRLPPRRCGIPMSAKCCHAPRCRRFYDAISREGRDGGRPPRCSRGSCRCAG